MTTTLKTFSSIQQQYGDFFAGFRWSIIGCGTFEKKATVSEAQGRLKYFMRRLGVRINARIPYVAVCERRPSGCGLPAIAAHYHFLAACPKQWKPQFAQLAEQEWFKQCGNAKVENYQETLDGAYYMAKLAGRENFEYTLDNLNRLSYSGASDLVRAGISNPYVPKHAYGIVRLNTMVVRDSITGKPV